MPTSPTMEVFADLRTWQQQKRAAQIGRVDPNIAPCKFDSAQVDLNNACLKCGAGEAEDCRDI